MGNCCTILGGAILRLPRCGRAARCRRDRFDFRGAMSAKKKSSGLSLRGLAAIAGVSVSTVSRALHNHAAISAAVRKRLQALARKHGYELNPLVAQVYAKARAGRGFGHLG